ncbi:hypothetical protein ACFQE4_23500 [Streptomyces thermocoprophilus]|uniref:Secreted protein n=1 Tax=Streptomyces thermocoprophilus TaxID=78356 RepID=A0ABV5VEH8_9ACTN
MSLKKIGAFGTALAATFALAYGVADAVAPDSARTTAESPAHSMGSDEDEAHAGDTHGGDGPSAAHTPGGLQISERGYTLDLLTPRLTAGEKSVLRFAVRDADGHPVTSYRTEHEKELHLIVASRDLTAYRHLHPVRAADGTWSIATTLPEAGAYRVFADFTPAAEKDGLTLGTDLAVTGTYRPSAPPAPAPTATVDGYSVRLGGTLRAGEESELTFTVTRDGRAVTDLQPYLGAYGHLVALRSGDLAYLHVHPHQEAHGTETSGPRVSFTAAAPSAGTYRLFLDFKTGGTVHTAAFTLTAGGHGH